VPRLDEDGGDPLSHTHARTGQYRDEPSRAGYNLKRMIMGTGPLIAAIRTQSVARSSCPSLLTPLPVNQIQDVCFAEADCVQAVAWSPGRLGTLNGRSRADYSPPGLEHCDLAKSGAHETADKGQARERYECTGIATGPLLHEADYARSEKTAA